MQISPFTIVKVIQQIVSFTTTKSPTLKPRLTKDTNDHPNDIRIPVVRKHRKVYSGSVSACRGNPASLAYIFVVSDFVSAISFE